MNLANFPITCMSVEDYLREGYPGWMVPAGCCHADSTVVLFAFPRRVDVAERLGARLLIQFAAHSRLEACRKANRWLATRGGASGVDLARVRSECSPAGGGLVFSVYPARPFRGAS